MVLWILEDITYNLLGCNVRILVIKKKDIFRLNCC